MNKLVCFPAVALSALLLGACEGEIPPEDAETRETESEIHGGFRAPMVFTMDNAVEKNSILAFFALWNGALLPAGTFPTGGFGSGGGLGSQGAVVTSFDGRYLFAVNAGSDEVSSFEVLYGALVLRDIVPSGGVRPISLTTRGGLLVVLNEGSESEPGNITGFRLSHGRLTPIEGSTRSLSANTPVGPAQVGFSPSGRLLVVAEKATNTLTSYVVAEDGTPGAPIVTPSNGMTPFGFEFRHDGSLYVSEAFGGAENASAVSSYTIAEDGRLQVVEGSVATEQTAACWVAISRDGRFAYVTNTGSDSVSGYAIGPAGALERFDDGGVTTMTGDGPLDIVASVDGRYLYTLNGEADSITILGVYSGGRLFELGTVSGLPGSSVGIAAR